jgi:hypothetical protein
VAPGDDWLCGNAKTFRVLGSDGELRAPRQGQQRAQGNAAPKGEGQTLTLSPPSGEARLAVMYLDEAGNPGHVATVAVPQKEGETTRSPEGGTFGDPGTAPVTPPSDPGPLPTASISAPRYASDTSRSAQFKVSWSGTGAASFDVDVRGATGQWKALLSGSAARSLRFRGKAGRAYSFRARAHDLAGRVSGYSTATTVVPYDDRASRIAHSRGWSRRGDRNAYDRGVSLGPRDGTARMRFRGSRVAVIAPRSAGGGRLAIYIDGRRRKVVHLRGAAAPRAVVYGSPKLSRKRVHTVVVRVLSRGSARLDAIAVTP